VRLDLESLEDKLLRRGRGGWCFEQNLLLAHMLEAIGFEVTRLAARVRWNVPDERLTPRSHMLLRVRLPEGDCIADVGFGGLTLSSPLRLEPGVEQQTPHEAHRLVATGSGYRLEARIAGAWSVLYVFDLAEQQLADYEVSNWYLCNHPDSSFLSMVMAARAAPGVRHALRGVRYTTHTAQGTERREVQDVAEYRALLEDAFGIRLPDAPNLDEKLQRMMDERKGSDPISKG
jgi:N-hydroxyarylamine O-acetyltransferase